MQRDDDALFSVSAACQVTTSPHRAFAAVSDLGRSGEWSPECVGGEWVRGEPGTVGAVFRGENLRGEVVVPWAPVVRGRWFTESEVVAARSPHHFAWAMRDSRGHRQDSVWSFEIAPAEGGCVVTHRFVMGAPTEGIRHITAEMDEAQRDRFRNEWSAKLAHDLAETVQRLKAVLDEN